MKAVKINMNESGNKKAVKAVLTGSLVNSLITLASSLLLAVFLNIAGNIFEDVAEYIMLIPIILGSYTGGFTAAQINKSKGIIVGLFNSVIIMIIMLIIGFSVYNTDITYMFLLKAICLFLPGVVGGIKGVNKKEKFKI